MVDNAGYFIQNTHNINTIIGGDKTKGWKLMSQNIITMIFNIIIKKWR